MFTPISNSYNTPQTAVLLQVTPLDQLDPEAVALLEILSEESLDSEEAYYRYCEGRRAHCLTFIDDHQAANLIAILRWFEDGLSLNQVASLLATDTV